MNGFIKSVLPILPLLSLPISAQELSLEDILSIKVSIAAKTEKSQDGAASIVSVIPRADIEAWGARDMTDILRMVPGFEFGNDGGGVVGVSFRGVWVHEGKLLFMLNGLPVNDLGYGNLNILGSFPASIIDRVEFLRGPGSAVHGGMAEMAVVNIVTKSASDLKGARISGDVGHIARNNTAKNGNVSFGETFGDTKIAAHVGYGADPTSDRIFEDANGNKLRMGFDNHASGRYWHHILVDAERKGLRMRYGRHQLDFDARDNVLISNMTDGHDVERKKTYNQTLNIEYKKEIANGLTITPQFETTTGVQINQAVSPLSEWSGAFSGSPAKLSRHRGELVLGYDFNGAGHMDLSAGVISHGVENQATSVAAGAGNIGGVQDRANDDSTMSDKMRIQTEFALAQYSQTIGKLGFTIGGRYEFTPFGNAAAPQVGLTYIDSSFNAKLLYGRAFRIPTLWQAHSRGFQPVASNLRPETADSVEMELGHRFSPNFAMRANAFYTTIKKSIIFGVAGSPASYSNSGRVNTEGAEAEAQLRYPDFGVIANIGWHRAGKSNKDYNARLEAHDQFLGIAPLKANLSAFYKWSKFQVGPSATYLSSRYKQSQQGAYDFLYSIGAGQEVDKIDDLVMFNLNLRTQEFVNGWDFSLTMHNLFNAGYTAIQPYFGGHPEYPMNDRRVTFQFTAKI